MRRPISLFMEPVFVATGGTCGVEQYSVLGRLFDIFLENPPEAGLG